MTLEAPQGPSTRSADGVEREVRFFDSAAEFRRWLIDNGSTARELWVGFHTKASGRGGMTYLEALEQALCFGWIDGVRLKAGDDAYSQRFSPRRPRSRWSAVNDQRMQRLLEQGVVEPPGMRAYEAREHSPDDRHSYEADPQRLPEPYERELRASENAWAYFDSQPPHYRRTVTAWMLSAKQEATRRRRLATLVADCEAGRWIKAFAGTAARRRQGIR